MLLPQEQRRILPAGEEEEERSESIMNSLKANPKDGPSR